MTGEYKQKTLEQIHEELFDAGLTPAEIKNHIMDVTWFRYLDTLTPFEAIFRQAAVPSESHSYSDNHGYDEDWMGEEMTPEEMEYVEEAIAEREQEKKDFAQMKLDVKMIKDKWNDVLIEQYFEKMINEGSIKDDDGNNDLKDKDKKSKKEKGE